MDANRAAETTVKPTSASSSDQFAGHTAKDQLEYYFNDMFRKYGVCNLQLLKQHFQVRQQDKSTICSSKLDSQALDPANLLPNVNDEMFRVTLNKLAGNIHNAYYLKSHGTPDIDKVNNALWKLLTLP